MKTARILQLRRPKWDAVKRQWDANKSTTYGKVYAAVTGVYEKIIEGSKPNEKG